MDLIAFIGLTIFGLWAGTVVARKAEAKKPLAGGQIGRLMHYLAAAVASVLPLVLITTAVILRWPFGQSALMCGSLFLLQFVLLMMYAAGARGAKQT
jgi:hypothetical protein